MPTNAHNLRPLTVLINNAVIYPLFLNRGHHISIKITHYEDKLKVQLRTARKKVLLPALPAFAFHSADSLVDFIGQALIGLLPELSLHPSQLTY